MPQASKKVVGAFSKFAPVVNGGKSEGHDPASYWEWNFSGRKLLNFFLRGGMMEKYTYLDEPIAWKSSRPLR